MQYNFYSKFCQFNNVLKVRKIDDFMGLMSLKRERNKSLR